MNVTTIASRLLAALLCSGLSLPAVAETRDAGLLAGSSYPAYVSSAAGSFNDVFNFTPASPSDVSAASVAPVAAASNYLFGLTALPVPEPEQWMLFAAGLLSLVHIARRRTTL